MIIEVPDGLLVKVPNDIKKPFVSKWSDGTTTLEFYSDEYEMLYDSFEIGVSDDKQLKEITLPINGNFKIFKKVPKIYSELIDSDKWYFLEKCEDNSEDCEFSEIVFNELSETDKELYSNMEEIIIKHLIEGTKTAGCLTRKLMYLINNK